MASRLDLGGVEAGFGLLHGGGGRPLDLGLERWDFEGGRMVWKKEEKNKKTKKGRKKQKKKKRKKVIFLFLL